MTAVRAIAILFLLLGVFGGVYWWWSRPERQIHRVLDALADALSHDMPREGLGAVAAVAGLPQYFAADVVLDPGRPFPVLTGRDAVVAAAARVRGALPVLRLELADRRIEMGADAAQAVVSVAVSARMTDRAGQQSMDAREVKLIMKRIDGRWVIARAEAVAALEPVTHTRNSLVVLALATVLPDRTASVGRAGLCWRLQRKRAAA